MAFRITKNEVKKYSFISVSLLIMFAIAYGVFKKFGIPTVIFFSVLVPLIIYFAIQVYQEVLRTRELQKITEWLYRIIPWARRRVISIQKIMIYGMKIIVEIEKIINIKKIRIKENSQVKYLNLLLEKNSTIEDVATWLTDSGSKGNELRDKLRDIELKTMGKNENIHFEKPGKISRIIRIPMRKFFGESESESMRKIDKIFEEEVKKYPENSLRWCNARLEELIKTKLVVTLSEVDMLSRYFSSELQKEIKELNENIKSRSLHEFKNEKLETLKVLFERAKFDKEANELIMGFIADIEKIGAETESLLSELKKQNEILVNEENIIKEIFVLIDKDLPKPIIDKLKELIKCAEEKEKIEKNLEKEGYLFLLEGPLAKKTRLRIKSEMRDKLEKIAREEDKIAKLEINTLLMAFTKPVEIPLKLESSTPTTTTLRLLKITKINNNELEFCFEHNLIFKMIINVLKTKNRWGLNAKIEYGAKTFETDDISDMREDNRQKFVNSFVEEGVLNQLDEEVLKYLLVEISNKYMANFQRLEKLGIEKELEVQSKPIPIKKKTKVGAVGSVMINDLFDLRNKLFTLPLNIRDNVISNHLKQRERYNLDGKYLGHYNDFAYFVLQNYPELKDLANRINHIKVQKESGEKFVTQNELLIIRDSIDESLGIKARRRIFAFPPFRKEKREEGIVKGGITLIPSKAEIEAEKRMGRQPFKEQLGPVTKETKRMWNRLFQK